MRTIRVIAATVLAVAAGTAAAATPAAAGPGGTLGIMITPLPGGMPSTPRFATLSCDPAGGTHPRAAQACEQLAAAGGDIAAVPPYPGMGCLPVWEPVTVTARGTWRGKAVDYTAQQPAVSCAQISHGVIFWI